MATYAPRAMLNLAERWENGIDSAFRREDASTFSGIVGDSAHRVAGGYHISREDQPATNYSIAQFTDDRLGPSNLASAIDMTMSRPAMILVTKRLADAWHRVDPRLDNVRGFNGTLDGVTGIRKDALNPDPFTTDTSTVDHTWHIHLEVFRRWADDAKTMDDILSVVLGEEGVTEVAIEGAHLDYLPDTAMAILTGETPSLGYPQATGPNWDNDAIVNHNLKAVEARLTALIKAQTAPQIDYEKLAKALVAELVKK